MTSTVWALLEDSARRHPERPAILAPGREPLTYRDLLALIEDTAGRLRALGLSRGSAVAAVMPNGPDMATAFVALAAACACAPLNPALTGADFERCLRGLGAQALLVEERSPAAAIAAAAHLRIPILAMRKRPEAGAFVLDHPGSSERPARPRDVDTALLLYTSGTTSAPKLVPLSSSNLTASARHIARALSLEPDDRCLNIMPLFHVHGLMAAVLASLGAGASVVCTDGLYARQFFGWMRAWRPTWYTAVPAMHQDILARAVDHADVIRDVPLRFLRSSSAPLPPRVLLELERTFGAPMVEAYGMTEAAHQITSNPIGVPLRREGSVGLAAGAEIAIMAPSGELLPRGLTGEVVIRGPNVTAGYRDEQAASIDVRRDGWFRTGDEGSIDRDGYLYLSGRLKDIINRGGEKVSPREIDEALQDCPGVRRAVSFAIPHARLGEEIGAAVELEPGARLRTSELRTWARARLPAFKVPRVIRIVDELGVGATGKVARADVAARLRVGALDGLGDGGVPVPPRTPTESHVAAVWRRLFPDRQIGVRTPFEALGGDSLLAVEMLAEVSAAVGFDVPHGEFLEEETIEALAAEIDGARSGRGCPLVALQPDGPRPPVYCIPGHDGILFGLARLARALPAEQPVWAFDLRQLRRSATVDDLAARCLDVLLSRDEQRPYRLAGVCFGGVVAAALAHHLEAAGRRVASVALIDALNPAWRRGLPRLSAAAARAAQLREKARYHTARMWAMDAAARLRYVADRGADFFKNHGESAGALLGLAFDRARHRRLAFRHTPRPVAAPALVVRVRGRRPHAPDLGWTDVFRGGVTTIDLPFNPHGALVAGSAERVAAIFDTSLSGT